MGWKGWLGGSLLRLWLLGGDEGGLVGIGGMFYGLEVAVEFDNGFVHIIGVSSYATDWTVQHLEQL